MIRRLAALALSISGLTFTAERQRPPILEPWPMFGGSPARNMVSPSSVPLSLDFSEEEDDPKVRVLGARIKWRAALGPSRGSSQPVVVGDKVFVVTNNSNPRNPRDRDKPCEEYPDGRPHYKGALMCFRASDGKFLWQMLDDKLQVGGDDGGPRESLGSAPTIERDRVYYVSTLCQVVCLDLNGLENGNDGFDKEKYQDKTDGDVIWSFDMVKELRVRPHNLCGSSPVIVGDLLFAMTGNGVDENHVNIPSPDAPSFVCLNKKTGKLVWSSNLPGRNIMHGQWSSPAYCEIKGAPQVLFPGGDGWLYSFEPKTGKLIWKFDANPKDAVHNPGRGIGSKSDFTGMPVIYQDRVYIGTGQDPEHFTGVAHFWCLNPAGKTGDISAELLVHTSDIPPTTNLNPNSGVVWHFGGDEKRPNCKREFVFGRTMSTACIADDVVYISEIDGYIHALDARSGKKYWQWDTRAAIWGSCYYADGKVLLLSEEGDLHFFKHEKAPRTFDEVADRSKAGEEARKRSKAAGLSPAEIKAAAEKAAEAAAAATRQKVKDRYLLRKVEIGDLCQGTPTMVGDTLYLTTHKTLYAIKAR